MRTTINIDDDVLQFVRERAAKERRSAGEILSELARRGVRGQASPGPSPIRNGIELLPPRGECVTLEHIQELLDEEAV